MEQVRFKRVSLKEGERGQVEGRFFVVFCSLAVWVIFPVPLHPTLIIIIIFLLHTNYVFKPVTEMPT